jgi:hypothetical protein
MPAGLPHRPRDCTGLVVCEGRHLAFVTATSSRILNQKTNLHRKVMRSLVQMRFSIVSVQTAVCWLFLNDLLPSPAYGAASCRYP